MYSYSRTKDLFQLWSNPSEKPHQSKTQYQYGRQRRPSSASIEELLGDSLDDFHRSLEKETEHELSEFTEIFCNLLALREFITNLQVDSKKKEESTYCTSTGETAIFGTTLLLFPRSVPRHPNAKDTLNQLEDLNICHKVFLNRIQLTGESDETKLRQLGDLKRTINDAQQRVTRMQCLVKKHYEMEQDIQKCFDGLHKACTEIDKRIPTETEFLTDEDKLKMCRKGGAYTDTVRVCSFLGLRLDFLDHLETVPLRIRNHRSLSDWIVSFLWENYESLSFSEKGSLTKELLISIGFESLTSIETILERSCAGNMQQHLEPCEWAAIIVEDEFKYNLLLSSQAEKFPFECNSRNTWFQRSRRNSMNEEHCPVKIKNLVVEKSEIHHNAESILRQLDLGQHQYTVFYHGTDHDSAKDILQRGVDLTTGRQKRDFSCGLGFYLTKDFSDALNWAKSITSKPALLIFQVKCGCFNKFRKRCFLDSIADDMKEWQKIVSLCRSGEVTAESQKLFTELDLLEGPKAILTGRNENDQLILEPMPSSYQICLFSEEIAEEFYRSLHSILFFDLS